MASIKRQSPIQILMVEDCKSDVLLFERMLGPIGEACQITNVARMIDAFKEIETQAFHLILVDLNLLDLDGIANVAAVKAECPQIPLVVYSGSGDIRLQNEARILGAAGYLVKGEASAKSVQATILQASSYISTRMQ